MKLNRIILAIVVFALALQATGCGKTWTANFVLKTNTTGWNQVEWYSPGTCAFEPEGLRINGYWVEAPYEFRGDFSVVYTFLLDTNNDRIINHLRMNVSDGNNGYRHNMIELHITDIGDPDWEHAEVLIKGDDVQHVVSEPDLSLNRTGVNLFVISKKGNYIKMSLNTKPVADFYIDDYPPVYAIDYFIPAMYAYTGTGGLVHFMTVTVKYDGTMVQHIY
ncbi:MAG TPA: hypothetical protein PLT03_04410 [Bacillota bacterium]|nr:hypothetical protein [Bacillota bacterium]HOG53096.1 hypothetical protein [Bacillota bacterium]